jgi:ATP-dependent Lon protease
MATALFSLVYDVPLKPGFAMTGELNLSGVVMPVGGIKEKLIAAKRAKLKRVIMPKANEADYEALPDPIRRGLDVHFVTELSEVLLLCLPAKGAWRQCLEA